MSNSRNSLQIEYIHFHRYQLSLVFLIGLQINTLFDDVTNNLSVSLQFSDDDKQLSWAAVTDKD